MVRHFMLVNGPHDEYQWLLLMISQLIITHSFLLIKEILLLKNIGTEVIEFLIE